MAKNYGNCTDLAVENFYLTERVQMTACYNYRSSSSPPELEELKGYLKDYKVLHYTPTDLVRAKYMDGGVAIIDQWICAHARRDFYLPHIIIYPNVWHVFIHIIMMTRAAQICFPYADTFFRPSALRWI